MKLIKPLREKTNESVTSVLPISAIVLLLSISVAPLGTGVMTLFLFGTLLLILGMGLFTLGAEMSMQPLGEGIGAQIGKAKRRQMPLALGACFILGALVTVAEPDLQVLAEQIPSIPSATMIAVVAAGVGAFLMLAMVRTVFGLKLSHLLWVLYPLILVLALFSPATFIPAAFDAGGVTTGPMTVPFIMALGAGMASLACDTKTGEESFGLIALCSVGPILAVLILSICFRPTSSAATVVLTECRTTREAFGQFWQALPVYGKEVLLAISPIGVVFVLFQALFRRFHWQQITRICIGMLYTYGGLVLFLTGANVGFMPAGRLLGAEIAQSSRAWVLIPVGMLIGYFVVAAEPAVHVLKRQVEEISNGEITASSIGLGLAVGVAISVGISMLRVLTGIPLYPFMVGGYLLSLAISFFVPSLYTSVAFDSGGVASGPMTTTFILPFAVGACEALGRNVLTDAFGIVAMVALTPLLTIQAIGLVSKIKHRRAVKKIVDEFSQFEDSILYYDREGAPHI